VRNIIYKENSDFEIGSNLAAMSLWNGEKNANAQNNPREFEEPRGNNNYSGNRVLMLAMQWLNTAAAIEEREKIAEIGGVIYKIDENKFISGDHLRKTASQFYTTTFRDCALLCSNRVPECGAWTWKKREPMAGYCYLKQTLDIGRKKYYRRDSDKYVSGFATVANQTHCRGNDFNRDSIFDLEKDLQGCWELADSFLSEESQLHYCQPARESGCYQLTCTETFVEGSSMHLFIKASS
jgi:hypothetical protein